MRLGVQKELQRELIADAVSPQTTATEGTRMERFTTRALGMRRKAATVLLFVACGCLGAYAVFGHDGLLAYQQKQHQSHQLQQQILSLKQENQRLALHDQRLQSDPDTLEYEAREQMHYTRPGEVIYTLPEAPGAAKHK